MGKRFCLDTGITFLNDYAVIDLMGSATLLTHGDLLCTDDAPYQAFRTKSHTIEWQENVLSKPLLIRLLAARWYRFRSYLHKRKKSQSIMDVNQETVIRVMQEHDCLRLIHGHTHRPNIHDFLINNHPAQRFVLSAWSKETGEVLCWNNKGYQIETL